MVKEKVREKVKTENVEEKFNSYLGIKRNRNEDSFDA